MRDVLSFLVVAGGLAAAMAAFAWLAARTRRRGLAGEMMNIADEIFHPAAHRYHTVIQEYEERTVPAPSPDDRWRQDRRD